MNKVISFSGPRPKSLFGYRDDYSWNELIEWLKQQLKNAYAEGFRTYISGGAQGFDQCCFWAIDKLKRTHSDISNVLYLPCRTQSSKWDDNGLFGKKNYLLMLERADKISYVQNEYSVKCLMERNHRMADDSDRVLILYPNDSWFDSGGGTAEMFRHCFDNKIPYQQITYDPYDILSTLEIQKIKVQGVPLDE